MTDLADLFASVTTTVRGFLDKADEAIDCITGLQEERQCFARLEEAVAQLEETARDINTRLATVAQLADKICAGTLPDPAHREGQPMEGTSDA